jgi:hypothetical protein
MGFDRVPYDFSALFFFGTYSVHQQQRPGPIQAVKLDMTREQPLCFASSTLATVVVTSASFASNRIPVALMTHN